MRANFYKALVWFCSLFGTIGAKIQSWAEFKQWEYWNDEQWKIVDLPEDVKVFLRYNRKGDFLRISVNYWPKINGVYDRDNRPNILQKKFTREEIHQLCSKYEKC